MEDQMELKEKIKKEIDLIPEEYLAEIEKYLKRIKRKKIKRDQIRTLSLKGKYDKLNIRKSAYE